VKAHAADDAGDASHIATSTKSHYNDSEPQKRPPSCKCSLQQIDNFYDFNPQKHLFSLRLNKT
jgi:hypothetical protein